MYYMCTNNVPVPYHVLQVVEYSEQLSPVPAGRPPSPRACQPRRVHQHLRALHPPQLRDPHAPRAGDTGHAGLQGPNTGQVKVIMIHVKKLILCHVLWSQEELRKAGSTCPVCLEEMHVSRVTPCGHVFHAHCLRQCLARSTACPYCRAKIL